SRLPSSKTPLPWLTRCTGTLCSFADSITARKTRGPSTLGISNRYCPPSGKRFLVGSSAWLSWVGSLSLARNCWVFLIVQSPFCQAVEGGIEPGFDHPTLARFFGHDRADVGA